MILLFKLIVICSIWVLGIKIATSDGMLLEKLGNWAERKVDDGHRIFEALLVCIYCMPSLHGIIAYGFAWGIGLINLFEWRLVFMYPLVVMGSSMLNGLIWGIHELLGSMKESNDAITRNLNTEDELQNSTN